ncbi:MAG: GNAT family N-acetyltransferase [bacterium]
MVREIKKEDRELLKKITYQIDIFNDEEKEVAMELIDDAINCQNTSYITYVYEEKNNVIGYYIIGKRALTDGVYDLYWIVVTPEFQNKGVGKILLAHAENYIMVNKGRWVLAETSSKISYDATRKFYLRNSYSIVCEIEDFYSIGDSLIVFGKYFKI